MNKRIANNLERKAQFALFVTSYLPLFILIIFKQIYKNFLYLKWGGFDLTSINLFIEKFGLSIILSFVSIYGYYGAMKTLKNIHKSAENGFPVKITDIENKNSESIGYIATYIIPFASRSSKSPDFEGNKKIRLDYKKNMKNYIDDGIIKIDDSKSGFDKVKPCQSGKI